MTGDTEGPILIRVGSGENTRAGITERARITWGTTYGADAVIGAPHQNWPAVVQKNNNWNPLFRSFYSNLHAFTLTSPTGRSGERQHTGSRGMPTIH